MSAMLKCWQNLSKLTNHRVYQILVHRDDLLLSFHRRVFSLPLAALFFFYRYIFSLAVFYTAAWLTERLEEATWDEATILRTNNNWQLRKILEAWEINCAKDPLNRDDGALLPKEYLHLTLANNVFCAINIDINKYFADTEQRIGCERSTLRLIYG